jgi:hypothetical protein
MEADDEGSDNEASDEDVVRPSSRKWTQTEIKVMYAHRYEAPREDQHTCIMHHVLTIQKDFRPDHSLRISPMTFDKVLAKIAGDPVFFNKSNTPQQPVEEQLAVVLFRFGHYGNAASLQNVAKWAGVG